jgi:hypothetical protein
LAGQVVEKRVHDTAAHVAVVHGEDIKNVLGCDVVGDQFGRNGSAGRAAIAVETIARFRRVPRAARAAGSRRSRRRTLRLASAASASAFPRIRSPHFCNTIFVMVCLADAINCVVELNAMVEPTSSTETQRSCWREGQASRRGYFIFISVVLHSHPSQAPSQAGSLQCPLVKKEKMERDNPLGMTVILSVLYSPRP